MFEEATFQLHYMENMDHVMKGITQLAMPGGGKFNYPTDKKRTKQTTEAMMTAEKNLDLFWFRFDVNWKRLAGQSIADCMGDHTPRQKGQQKERTAPWVEPVKEQKTQADSKALEPKEWVEIKDSKIPVAVTSKQKVKTKGVSQTVNTEEATHDAPSAQADKQPVFKVDKSSMKVFNTLFFTHGQAKAPGEIPWVDFLRAMGSTGFAAQKLYGSIWQFTPTKLDVERSIQFHEPHPAVKIRFPVARRMGRRLTRAYGWHGGMFELE
jgi:hypothetical protein